MIRGSKHSKTISILSHARTTVIQFFVDDTEAGNSKAYRYSPVRWIQIARSWRGACGPCVTWLLRTIRGSELQMGSNHTMLHLPLAPPLYCWLGKHLRLAAVSTVGSGYVRRAGRAQQLQRPQQRAGGSALCPGSCGSEQKVFDTSQRRFNRRLRLAETRRRGPSPRSGGGCGCQRGAHLDRGERAVGCPTHVSQQSHTNTQLGLWKMHVSHLWVEVVF